MAIMTAFNRRYPLILFVGDVCIFFISLWISLILRYKGLPSLDLWAAHILPFSILFVVWFLVFYIAGLYEKWAVILRSRLATIIFQVQLANSIIAVAFFYFIPYFQITPKTTLFIYIVVSLLLILGWRVYGSRLLGLRRRQNAILIASGSEMRELRDEVNKNSNYSLKFISSIDLDAIESLDFEREIVHPISHDEVSVIAIDFKDTKIDPILPALYNLIFSNMIFIDMYKIYEDVFDRIPLSLITYSWFLENISLAPKVAYDFLKRIMDIIISVPLGLVSLIVYPFVIVAIALTDRGPLFFYQERVGKGGKPMWIVKFRSMTTNAEGVYDEQGKIKNKVTPFGTLLRKSRIDELPQLWNVIKGDLSLIGPRPELPALVGMYEKEIPYYGIRHIIKPGLSGWAQLYHDNHPHHGLAVEQTKEKLSYDLYYLKNRSFMLDITIALKTIKKLLSRSGA
jgi:exopolysaccharide biosynthesis polyprenyl glycosylphosphotransferase